MRRRLPPGLEPVPAPVGGEVPAARPTHVHDHCREAVHRALLVGRSAARVQRRHAAAQAPLADQGHQLQLRARVSRVSDRYILRDRFRSVDSGVTLLETCEA